MTISRRFVGLTTTTLLLLAGCGGYAPSPQMAAVTTAGVTTGGAQDMGLARSQVAAGQIPRPDSFTIEGMLSEHDIDVAGPACDQLFCVTTATGLATALDTNEPAAFVVLGMSSGIDLATFERRPQNIAVVLDRSGSMSGGKIEAARRALHRLVDQLGPQDRLSIVLFDDRVDVLLRSTELDQGSRHIHRAIEMIQARGSTDIESGLSEGYAQVSRNRSPFRADRVILFTDALPNTGRTDRGSFLELARAYGSRGVGLTVFGVGLDFGQDLGLAISRVPGANYFFLEDEDRLATVFDRDFDLLVTPVAWDFELVVRPAEGYRITEAYGVPAWNEGDGAARLTVPTLFLSRNRGAIVFRMEPDQGSTFTGRLARASLAYRQDQGGSYSHSRADVVVGARPEDGRSQPGVELAVALVNAALGLQQASLLAHGGRPGEALATLSRVDSLVADERLGRERRLVEDLRHVILAHHPQLEGPLASKDARIFVAN